MARRSDRCVVPGCPDYEITPHGVIYVTGTHRKMSTRTKGINESVRVWLRDDSGEQHSYVVAELVLATYVSLPPACLEGCSRRVIYRDGDRRNLDVDNLEWNENQLATPRARTVRSTRPQVERSIAETQRLLRQLRLERGTPRSTTEKIKVVEDHINQAQGAFQQMVAEEKNHES